MGQQTERAVLGRRLARDGRRHYYERVKN
jgi:hypothetical protein